ncbi:MAG: PSD1 and planctomycete cytochrome C domain-containing protein, partial [Planctomycetaceae bacterium]
MTHQTKRSLQSLFLASGLLSRPCAGDDGVDHFESRVRPLLVKRCHSCHARTAKAGLRLDSRQSLLQGGKSGPAAVPGDPGRSLLIQVVSGKHTRLKMPPKKPLAPREVSALVRWVRDGVPWGEMQTADAEHFTKPQLEFWSWQPLKPTRVPQVESVDWNRNPIDAYIFDSLVKHQLQPAAVADKRTLIRRATFDLTGLPATAAAVEQFLADESPQAYELLLQKLLESPQYGARWGRHWLDLVRYADTAGDAADYPVPEAYKYRNYVIDAFNRDLPYDAFVRQQIAGDLLPAESEKQRWRQTIATGYIAISRRIGVSPHGMRHITIEDTIDNLGKTFLGLTIGCARCHDHKFDPIPSTDYYALYGIFDSSVYPHAGAAHKPHREDFVYRVGRVRAEEMERSYRAALEPWNQAEREKFAEYQLFQKKKINDPSRTRQVVWQELVALREQRRSFAEAFPDLEIAYAIQEGDPHDTHVQQAGDPRSKGELVRRGFPEILGGQDLPDDDKGSGRLALAGWIADAANPLTARVMVNRIWHHHFGRGLVATTSDFGLRGTPPTHPELLDFLARAFIEHGW